MLLLAVTIQSHRVFAQSVTITLMPGWNWISVPMMDTLDFETALGSFTPAVGDMIKSQWSNASYRADGHWRGQISQFYPGYGYKYYSNRTMPVMVTFTAQEPAPQVIVTTAEPTEITSTSAIGGGDVTTNEETYIVEKGICWSTNPNPTLDDNAVEIGSGAGSFTASMTALIPNTMYYVCAFAVMTDDTIFGEPKSFTTLESSGSNSPIGAINGLFTINADGDQVYFSQGNLQYQASTNTWQFAENQWDYVGYSNKDVSSTYDGWIDLFGWGTSGYNGKNPYMTSMDHSGYGDDGHNEIAGTNYDWGVNNAISNGGNQAGMWRTLTSEEWLYLIHDRVNASHLRGQGRVNNVNGLILWPNGCKTSLLVQLNFKYNPNDYSTNVYSLDEWAIMQSHGAVFLPATGYRYGTDVGDVGSYGYYWLSSAFDSDYSDYGDADYLYFSGGMIVGSNQFREFGFSVRLVQDVQ